MWFFQKMVRLNLALVLSGLYFDSARAELILSIEQVGGSAPILVGQAAAFQVNLENVALQNPANPPFPAFTALSGLDYFISMNELNGTAGVFISGTNDIINSPDLGYFQAFPAVSNRFSAGPGDADRNSSSYFFTEIGETLRVSTLMLSTAGATPGNYVISFSEVLAINHDFQVVPISSQTFQYTVAVPEPSCVLLLGFAIASLTFRLRPARPRFKVHPGNL
jgi:hypothetical protein